MSIQLQDVKVLDNPAPFTSNFRFRITFDCIEPGVKEELEWKLVYVGSADNEDNDQELDQILVGPVRVGKNRFTFEAPAPNPTLIPSSDLLDVTVILLTCSYREQEFIRIGYYVHNEYEDEIDDNDENIVIIPQKIKRNILADKPRVTRFNIDWDNNNNNNKEKLDEETKSKEDINSNNNSNNSNQNDEQDDNDDDNNDDDDDDDDEEEDDANFEEDLADTEERDNKTNNDNKQECNSNNNNNNNNEEDDDDIDMTE